MLIKNESEIRKYVPATVAFKLEQIEPVLKYTATPELKRWMGETFHDEIEAKYLGDAYTMTAKEKKLLELLQNYLVNFAFHHHITTGAVVFTQNTIGVLETENLKPASQYKIAELKRHFAEAAGMAEEQTLKYLETEKATFTTWASSPERTTFAELFITTAEQFSEYHEINSSRRLFRAIRSIMKRVEQDSIRPVLCDGLFDQLKTEVQAGTTTAENLKLLPYIRTAVAKLTIAEALIELPMKITPEGVQLVIHGDTQNMELREKAPDPNIIALQKKAEWIALDQLRMLRELMEVNISDYPLYSSSSCYQNPESETEDLNDPENPIILL